MDYLKERDLVEQRRRHLDETLNPKIALRNTAYDDQGKLPCDKDTRVEILADITNWVNDVSPKSQNFFWMTGDPGCGKSAIAASLARYCKDEGVLWAQFFINRNNEATTNPRVYFPSIARQMAKHSSAQLYQRPSTISCKQGHLCWMEFPTIRPWSFLCRWFRLLATLGRASLL
jgi:DNA replication protein DnaC